MFFMSLYTCNTFLHQASSPSHFISFDTSPLFSLLLLPALSTFSFSFSFPMVHPSSIKTFLLLSEAVIPYPGLPMYTHSLSFSLSVCVSLYLSIRGMSFNMPPVTSHSQEAHPTSHSLCPLFLNEGHMCCGQHWS